MIDAIKRRLTKPERDPWDANQELEPEVEDTSELPTDTAVLLAATRSTSTFSPSDWNLADYYKGIIRTALDNGGKYGDHEISIPWLRMILAGLENRPIEPEMLWYMAGQEDSTGITPGIPSYDALFPSDRDPSTTLG